MENNTNNKKRVLVGMSGGVDSSVAALLLLRQGYDVVGATFKLYKHGGVENSDVEDARAVCEKLGIPHHVFDFTDIFVAEVVEKFVDSYSRGLTPNPCVDCNKKIKFGEFMRCADKLGAEFVATGHYGRVVQNPQSGRMELHRSEIDSKDQSYVLYSLTQQQLARLVLPLSSLDKTQVRALAEEAGFEIFAKPDSQDVCFIPNGTCTEFLESYTGKKCPKGNFVDPEGNVIGTHNGIWSYTIGQRKGLGTSFGQKLFVSEIDSCANTVTLSPEEGLYSSSLFVEDINLIPVEEITAPMELDIKARYSAKPQPATVYPPKDGRAEVVFKNPQRAITKGQAAVFYSGSLVFGGGTII